MNKFILAFVITLITSNVMSLDNDKYYKVKHIYSWTNGHAHIWLDENGGQHSCSDQKYSTRYLISRDYSNEYDQKFSLLLTAKTSGQPVSLKYTCDNNGLPWVSAVRF